MWCAEILNNLFLGARLCWMLLFQLGSLICEQQTDGTKCLHTTFVFLCLWLQKVHSSLDLQAFSGCASLCQNWGVWKQVNEEEKPIWVQLLSRDLIGLICRNLGVINVLFLKIASIFSSQRWLFPRDQWEAVLPRCVGWFWRSFQPAWMEADVLQIP